MSKRVVSTASVLGLFLATHSPVRAQVPTRLGGELQVDTYTSGTQDLPAVAMQANGDFVVVWERNDSNLTAWTTYGRRFTSTGDALGAEFLVTLGGSSSQQRFPALATAESGDFIVAWTTAFGDGNYHGVFARRFDSVGNVVGDEFQVNSYVTSYQTRPAVAMSAVGDFVVAWQSYGQDGFYFGVFARRFTSAGVPLAAEFQVNSYTSHQQYNPAVAMDSEGGFVITWTSLHQESVFDQGGVFARRFDSAGTALAAEFQVNTLTYEVESNAAVAMKDDGDFVVVWQQSYAGSQSKIVARRFTSSGSALADEFQINSHLSDYKRYPALAADGAGNFIVAWQSQGQDGSDYGVFARRFTSAGVPLTADFQANSYTTGAQRYPAVALKGSGAFVVAWQSNGQDGSADGVFAQRFAPPAILDIDGSGTVTALSDGLLILRYLFGFTGSTLIGGAVDTGACTRCDAPAIQAYLATLV